MAQFTEFGKLVKKMLIDFGHTQSWLIDEIQARTGLYCDSSYLNKVLTGKNAAPKIKSAICEILNIAE